jgi:hypothetical protein
MTAVSARFGTDSAALALISVIPPVPDRLPTVAFAVRIWHRTAVGARTSPFNIFGCGCSSVVEHDLAKVGVEGSSPFARSKFPCYLNPFRPAAERRPCPLFSGEARGKQRETNGTTR